MKLLAVETSGPACSAAAWDGDAPEPGARLRGHRRFEAGTALGRGGGRGHAEALLPMVLDVLDEAGWVFADLDALAVDRGPGGFTGIRVGVAAARGLALAAGLPVVGVGGLEALAATAAASAPDSVDALLLAALDARRGQVYAQTFAIARDGLCEPLDEPRAVAPAAAAADLPVGRGRALVLVGPGAALVRPHVSPTDGGRVTVRDDVAPDAAAVAALAAARLARDAGAAGSGFGLTPLYLRPPDARPQTPLVAATTAAAAGAGA